VKNWVIQGTLLTAALTFAGAVPLAAQSQTPPPKGPDVVEAARKAREAKKNQPKARIVLDNDSLAKPPQAEKAAENAEAATDEYGNPLPRPAPVPVQEETATAAADSASASAADQKPRFGGLTEAEWRAKFAEMRGKIATAEKEADVLQRELNLNQVQYYSDPNKALREQYTRNEINRGTSRIDTKKAEIAALKQQLSDLEDQLRKAGGPSGWSRE